MRGEGHRRLALDVEDYLHVLGVFIQRTDWANAFHPNASRNALDKAWERLRRHLREGGWPHRWVEDVDEPQFQVLVLDETGCRLKILEILGDPLRPRDKKALKRAYNQQRAARCQRTLGVEGRRCPNQKTDRRFCDEHRG